MHILYVLDRPELSGGVKVVFEHAALLRELGARVTVAGIGPRPEWTVEDVRYVDRSRQTWDQNVDIAIATYWTTIGTVKQIAAGRRIHFCQGYEGQFPHLARQHEQIRQAYSGIDWPAWVVSPHLGDVVRAYGRSHHVISPPIELSGAVVRQPDPARKPRIFLGGIFECTWKGIHAGLGACRLLARWGADFDLVRVSLLEQSDAERELFVAAEYHCRIDPSEVRVLLATCDLCLFPSHPEEGFGLPLLEAMASGLPAVASDIPSARYMVGSESIPLIGCEDVVAFAVAARELLGDRIRWEDAREAGLRCAARFAPDRIKEQLRVAVEAIID